MKPLLLVILYLAVAFVLLTKNITVATWQYWAIFLFIMCIYFTAGIDGK